ncbi:hypothetical protein ACQPU1_17560 [Clostridium paraputrificum]|uniref:hypothetical protein n=1 Tax=Clostridium paraputrificum TaxID=29363 RepID=UPI003D344A05
MKTYFKLELKKAIFSWKTMLSIIILTTLFIAPYLKEGTSPYLELDGVDMFLRISGFSYIGYIAPVVVGLIYSTSIIEDKQSGFMDKIIEIIDRKTYFKVKLLVNSLANSIIFGISYGIVILYLIISLGISSEIQDEMLMGSFVKGSVFIGIYDISKLLYIVTIFLLVVISSVAFSTFLLAVTTVSKKKIIAYILPIFYVVLTGVFFEIWVLNGIVDFNITRLFNIAIYRRGSGIGILLYDLILMLLGIGFIYRFAYKENLKLKEIIE